MEIPYITEAGTPIHKVSEAEQRGYMALLTVEEQADVLAHANALAARIRGYAAERAAMKSKSRSLLQISASASPDDKAAQLKSLEDLSAAYSGLADEIEALKATTYTKVKGKDLIIPPLMPRK